MRALRVFAQACVVSVSVAGCQQTTSEIEYAGDVRVTSPELIEVAPNVQVLADADEPLFYSQGYYWLYRDGSWYRSDSYRGGFASVELPYVPSPVRAIDRPELYVQYRRNAGRDQLARRGPRPVRSQQPAPTPPPNQGVPSTPAPETWQPTPQPPLTSPNDTRPMPMPPHQEPIDDRDPPGTTAPGSSTPQDRDDQATPPTPHGDRGARPDATDVDE